MLDQGKGPAVAFHHGLLLDHTTFEGLIDGVRALRWDARGHGRTGWDGRPFRLQDLVDDAAEVLTSRRAGPVVFVGAGMGGAVGLRLALQHPALVSGLLLIGSRAWSHTPQERQQWRDIRWPHDRLRVAEKMLGRPSQLWSWVPRWTIDTRTFTAIVEALLDRDEVIGALGRVEVPAMVVHGTADVLVPHAHAEALCAALPGATSPLTVIGATHALLLSHTGTVRAALHQLLDEV